MTHEDIRESVNWRIMTNSRVWLESPKDEFAVFTKHAAKELPYSDLQSAQWIYECFSDTVHYVPGLGEWRVWNGVYHERIDGDLLADWLADTYVKWHKEALVKIRARYDTATSAMSGEDKAKAERDYQKGTFGEHRSYRDKIHSHGGIMGLTAQIRRVFSVSDNYFSDDRQWLVLENGVIDLHDLRNNPPAPGDLASIKLLEHDPARPVFRCMNASLDPEADDTRWLQFIRSSQPDPDLRKFLAVVAGAAFLGESKTKTIPVLKGPKDSGKTVFIQKLDDVSGDYGVEPDGSSINVSSNQNFEQDLFRAKRFVGISEPDTSHKLDESFLKKFTGGDTMSTRTLHARPVSWISQGVLFIATNNEMKFKATDRAIVDRLATVNFPHRFWPKGKAPEGQEQYVRDSTLEFALSLEHNGILSWILNGMLTYLAEDGIEIPEVIEKHRDQQYAEGSSVFMWVDDQLKTDKTIWRMVTDPRPSNQYATVLDLHVEYQTWAVFNAPDDIKGRKNFSEDLTEYLGVSTVKSNSMRVPGIVAADRAHTV
jgi:P4 family phage/plasmid primase-like protien